LDLAERTDLWRSILAGEVDVPGVPKPADFVVERNEQVVGFADVGRFRDEPERLEAGELWAMYVAPSEWGNGAGPALMEATIDELARLSCTVAYLWVLEENPRARRFYERSGWTNDNITKPFEINGVSIAEIRYSTPVSDRQ